MYFPTICVDDFFDDPNAIINFALSQDFFTAPDGAYPGKRTKTLYDLDKELFEKFSQKFFSIFYNFNKTDVRWVVDARFQKIDPYETADLNEGWIHVDYTAVLSGVIYLTPEADKNAGTVLCKIKKGQIFDYAQQEKRNFNLGKLNDTEKYISLMKENNNKFEDTIYFSNQFNRMIAFDSTIFHKVQNFNAGNKSRLTLVFFVNKIESDWFPMISFKKIKL